MKDIILPKPRLDLEYPLMMALEKRRTKRKWKNDPLSIQEIADILWVACGETMVATKRSKNRRTVPSACSCQIVRVYAALESGTYKYIENEHKLKYINDKDLRCYLGTQKMMKSAPFGLIYIAYFDKKTGIFKSGDSEMMFSAGTEAGLMSQNMYLYATATNLSTVLLGLTDRKFITSALGLLDNSKIIYTQVVGKTID